MFGKKLHGPIFGKPKPTVVKKEEQKVEQPSTVKEPEIPTLGIPSEEKPKEPETAKPAEPEAAKPAEPEAAKPAEVKGGIFGKKNPFARGDDKPTPLFQGKMVAKSSIFQKPVIPQPKKAGEDKGEEKKKFLLPTERPAGENVQKKTIFSQPGSLFGDKTSTTLNEKGSKMFGKTSNLFGGTGKTLFGGKSTFEPRKDNFINSGKKEEEGEEPEKEEATFIAVSKDNNEKVYSK